MREIVLDELTTVEELARLLGVRETAVVGAALEELGLMVTVSRQLGYQQARIIAAKFDFTTRPLSD